MQDSASHWLVMNVAVCNIFIGRCSDEKQLVEDTGEEFVKFFLMRISPVETTAAEAAHLIEKKIKDATESTTSSIIENSKCAIERALAVAEEAAQHVPEIKKMVFLLQQGNEEQMVKILGLTPTANDVSPRVPACNYIVSSVAYELNVLRTRGPRRMNCVMTSIPVSTVQEGGNAPTPTSFPQINDKHFCSTPTPKGKGPIGDLSNSTFSEMLPGRVTVASVKNFQLVAAVEPCHNVSTAEQEKVIL
ncbi:hypothetical protein KIW84_014088 [Lathyrus oleraceus]|uniref:Tubby C-terminal domain-containing protein n=1 Tax=Pisum sativum TaxID=3888 RepID=A0A9D5BM65_PEA|nr:hypothetical protein KIW84_014088 [Pisum sativum]